MRITHALAYYGDYLGGIQVYVRQLARMQKKIGHKVRIVTCNKYGDQEKIDGIPISRTPVLFSGYRVPFTPLMPFKLLDETCDILHVHLPLPWLDLCAAFKRIVHPRTKLVVTIHNRIPISTSASRAFAWIHNRIFIPIALWRADAVICTTKSFAKSLPYTLSREKLHIIPLGVDCARFTPIKKFDANEVLFVGRMIPEKGLHILMQAMLLARKKNPALQLQVVTADNYGYSGYSQRIRELDDGFLHISELVPHDKIAKYYAHAAVTVMPSLDLDSFGYVLIESLACGTPVISSDLPGPSDIPTKNTGLVVARGNAEELARAILTMAKKSASMRNDCRSHALQHYDWSTIGQQIIEVYE